MTIDTIDTDTNARRLTPETLALAVEEYVHADATQRGLADDIPFDRLRYDVSAQMKRAAGKAIYRFKPCSPTEFTIRIAYAAYEAWGFGDRLKGVIRHEAAHVLAVERHGKAAANHGPLFERAADEFDAPRSCEQFAAFAYELRCEACDGFAAGRYRRSKVVDEHHRYRSGCCRSPLYLIDNTEGA
jgi:predicted SprT family Zn-dependent metalloprotease